MNFLQIQYFTSVAYYKNFTFAASEMHVSQPAVSKQIAALEEELGVKLFDRSGKRLKLTQSGELFYTFFLRMNSEFENTKRLAKGLDERHQNGKLSARLIFFIDWGSELFMFPLVKILEERYPLMELELENRGIFDIAPTLLDPRFDVTVCFDHLVPAEYREQLESRHLADVHRMVYFSTRHPLAMREELHFTDFKDEYCVALHSPKHPEPERTIRTICSQYGFEPKFRFKPNHDSVIMAVQSGRGYCILDEWSRNRENQSFRTLPLDFTRPVSAYWRKDNRNPTVPLVVDTLQELIRRDSAFLPGEGA